MKSSYDEWLNAVLPLVRAGAERLAAVSGEARRDAALLLGYVLQRERAWLLANPDAVVTARELERYRALLARRAEHEPIQYIVGEQEWYGLRFAVSREVLIPRPETEHLLEVALRLLPEEVLPGGEQLGGERPDGERADREALDDALRADEPPRVADVGTGSGILAVSLAALRPRVRVTALDLSEGALRVAAGNAARHGVGERIRFLHSDLLGAVGGERFDMIVSNPPYVPEGEVLEPQVARWEPEQALYAGATGLAIYERLIPQARAALVPGGWLLMEIGHGQRAAVAGLLEGWGEVRFEDDLQGIARVVLARLP